MTKEKSYKEVSIQGNILKCQICNHYRFWHRETLMNTPGMTFFGVEWANKSADNYICEHCGYVHWFLSK